MATTTEYLETVTVTQALQRHEDYWPYAIMPPEYRAQRQFEEMLCAVRNDPEGAARMLLRAIPRLVPR